MSRLFPVIIMENSLCFHVLCQGRPIIRRAWSRAISLRSVIPASFSGDINVVGWAGGPRRPEKMPGHNRAEGIPADGANYGNAGPRGRLPRSEEHTSEIQSLMRISYAVFCLKKKKIILIINI